MNDNAKLDGIWINGVFKLIIKGNTYISFYNGRRYGKGTILFGDDKFTLTSTHARWLFFWRRFVEEVRGNYYIIKNGVSVSNIEGRYCKFNGEWKNLFP